MTIPVEEQLTIIRRPIVCGACDQYRERLVWIDGTGWYCLRCVYRHRARRRRDA